MKPMISLSLLGASLLVASVLSAQKTAREHAGNQIRVEVSALRSDDGFVDCTLFGAPGDGFPGDPSKALATAKVRIRSRSAVCEFNGMGAGIYAVGMLHDENGNDQLDTNWLGIPSEGFGASRDAKPKFGPPKFRDAAFSYKAGAVVVRIQTRYGIF